MPLSHSPIELPRRCSTSSHSYQGAPDWCPGPPNLTATGYCDLPATTSTGDSPRPAPTVATANTRLQWQVTSSWESRAEVLGTWRSALYLLLFVHDFFLQRPSSIRANFKSHRIFPTLRSPPLARGLVSIETALAASATHSSTSPQGQTVHTEIELLLSSLKGVMRLEDLSAGE